MRWRRCAGKCSPGTLAFLRQAVRGFTDAGLPRRDVGELPGLSDQRVGHLLEAWNPMNVSRRSGTARRLGPVGSAPDHAGHGQGGAVEDVAVSSGREEHPVGDPGPGVDPVQQVSGADVDDDQVVGTVPGEVVDDQLTGIREHHRLHGGSHVEVPVHGEANGRVDPGQATVHRVPGDGHLEFRHVHGRGDDPAAGGAERLD